MFYFKDQTLPKMSHRLLFVKLIKYVCAPSQSYRDTQEQYDKSPSTHRPSSIITSLQSISFYLYLCSPPPLIRLFSSKSCIPCIFTWILVCMSQDRGCCKKNKKQKKQAHNHNTIMTPKKLTIILNSNIQSTFKLLVFFYSCFGQFRIQP